MTARPTVTPGTTCLAWFPKRSVLGDRVGQGVGEDPNTNSWLLQRLLGAHPHTDATLTLTAKEWA